MAKEYVKIAPESANIGDVIEVVYSEKMGITKRERGTVAHRENYSSGRRVLYTQEGGELYSWLPGVRVPGAIFRLGRVNTHRPETLPGMEES